MIHHVSILTSDDTLLSDPKKHKHKIKQSKNHQRSKVVFIGHRYLGNACSMLGKSLKTYSPKWIQWLFNGDLLWYNP